MKAQRYLRYLPDFVAEYAEFQKLGEIEGEILEEEAKAKQEMEQAFAQGCHDGALRIGNRRYGNFAGKGAFLLEQQAAIHIFYDAGMAGYFLRCRELSSEAGSWSLSADHCAGAERKAKEGTDFVILEDIDSGKSGL